jgi:site-specific DNA-adenine methylase
LPGKIFGWAEILFIDVGDAEFLRCFDYASAGRVLIYSDPPYLPETRTSSALSA